MRKFIAFLLIFFLFFLSCAPISKDEQDENKDTDKSGKKDTLLLEENLEVKDSTHTNLQVEKEKNKTKVTITNKKEAPKKAKKSAFEETYDYALNRLYNSGDYERAIAVFSALIENHPRNSLTDNCYFWLGMSYYNSGDYLKALNAFEKALAEPKSNKAADAQKWIARCKEQLEDQN